MWADNETPIDLLGCEYLVDSLEILLTEPRLLPVTIGVTGDWGSGKSSLMHLACSRLTTGDNAGKYIPVSFSPWRFEDYATSRSRSGEDRPLLVAAAELAEQRLCPRRLDPEALEQFRARA